MLLRAEVIDRVLGTLRPSDCVVAALGNISRDLHAATAGRRELAFCCLGSMGSVAPLALGIALARPDRRVLALEGDGSLLMNLGTVATLRRYAPPTLSLIVFDNRCYESTGGQPSQSNGLRLEAVCSAAGLATGVAQTSADLTAFLDAAFSQGVPSVLVAKVAPGPSGPRIREDPPVMARRFAAHLGSVEAP